MRGWILPFKLRVKTQNFAFLSHYRIIQMRLQDVGCWALIALEITISAFWPGYRRQLRCRNTLPAVCFLFWQTCTPRATYCLFMKVSKSVSAMRLHGCLRLLMCANSCWCFNGSLERVYTESGIGFNYQDLIRRHWWRNILTTCREHKDCMRQSADRPTTFSLSRYRLESPLVPPNDRMLGVCCFSAMNTDSSLCHSPQFPRADQSDDCLSAWRRMGF